MKITIDTKEDSHEDIIKIVQLLSELIEKKPTVNEPELSEESGSLLASMFGEKTEKKTTETANDEDVRVIPY